MKTKSVILLTLIFFLPAISNAQVTDRLHRSQIQASPGNNGFLKKNSWLLSPNGQYYLIMQSDGNLVLYRGSDPNDNQGVIWHTNTYTGQETDSYLAMQDDGNLVVYRGQPGDYSNHVWNSETNRAQCNYYLSLQDDGNLVIYLGSGSNDNRGAIWSVKTGKIGQRRSFIAASSGNNGFLNKNDWLVSPCGSYYLIMQSDGNLVLYKGSGPENNQGLVWHTQTFTWQETDSYLAIQDDGNLVVYRGQPLDYSNPVWSSKTYGELGSYYLIVQDDGNLVIYRGTGLADNKGAIWSIQTGKL